MAPSPWDDLGTFYPVFGAGNYPQDQGTRPAVGGSAGVGQALPLGRLRNFSRMRVLM
jgi:hypothetical protein